MPESSVDIWKVVHVERRRLADDLESLTAEHWTSASLCAGWDVHDVLAHLLDTARTTRLSFVRDMLTSRGDFDRANARGVVRAKASTPRDTLSAFRASANLTRTPPAPLATRLVEAIVHGEDIRRPLEMAGSYPEASVAAALAHQVRTSVAFGGGRQHAEGLRLLDTATGQAWGAGEDVEGLGVDLLLVVSGRPVDADRFTGPGVARFLKATGSSS